MGVIPVVCEDPRGASWRACERLLSIVDTNAAVAQLRPSAGAVTDFYVFLSVYQVGSGVS